MTTALFMAAVLAMAQTETTPPAASVVVPTAQAVTPPPAPSQVPSQAAPPAPASAPESAPESAIVSTAPQDDLDSAPTVRPFEMSTTTAPPGPVPYETADAPANTSVKVEAYHRDYEGPQDAEQAYYEAGVKSAFEAEQALRGRLEGMWIVSTADGAPLLSLVISDPGRPDAPPGGAWRDLSRAHEPDAHEPDAHESDAHELDSSGLIDQVVEEAASVIVQIRLKAGAPPATLRLTPSADGRWRGLLRDGGEPKPVVMDRKAI